MGLAEDLQDVEQDIQVLRQKKNSMGLSPLEKVQLKELEAKQDKLKVEQNMNEAKVAWLASKSAQDHEIYLAAMKYHDTAAQRWNDLAKAFDAAKASQTAPATQQTKGTSSKKRKKFILCLLIFSL